MSCGFLNAMKHDYFFNSEHICVCPCVYTKSLHTGFWEKEQLLGDLSQETSQIAFKISNIFSLIYSWIFSEASTEISLLAPSELQNAEAF